MSISDFNYDTIYYRVIDRDPVNSTYHYDLEEMEIMTTGHGIVKLTTSQFEFDDINRVGRWLYLGKTIRRIKIPPESNVVLNTPFSQGGCYSYGSHCVELLDILTVEDFLHLLVSHPQAEDVDLHIAYHHFSHPVALPRSLYSLNVTHCTFSPVAWPADLQCLTVIGNGEKWNLEIKHLNLKRLYLVNFEFDETHFPIHCDDISLSNCIIFSSFFAETTQSISCSDCLVAHVKFPSTTTLFANASVLEDCLLPIKNQILVGPLSWQCEILNSQIHPNDETSHTPSTPHNTDN